MYDLLRHFKTLVSTLVILLGTYPQKRECPPPPPPGYEPEYMSEYRDHARVRLTSLFLSMWSAN